MQTGPTIRRISFERQEQGRRATIAATPTMADAGRSLTMPHHRPTPSSAPAGVAAFPPEAAHQTVHERHSPQPAPPARGASHRRVHSVPHISPPLDDAEVLSEMSEEVRPLLFVAMVCLFLSRSRCCAHSNTRLFCSVFALATEQP